MWSFVPSALCGFPVVIGGKTGLSISPTMKCLTFHVGPTSAKRLQFRIDWLTSQARYVRGKLPVGLCMLQGNAPCHLSAKHCFLNTAESGKRNCFRPLLSEPDVKVSLHPAQASQRPCAGPVSSHTTCWLHDTTQKSIPISAPWKMPWTACAFAG